MTLAAQPAWHAGSLVGREQETAALHSALDRVAAGAPGIVEIGGEPGTGKTRLLVELAGAARARGVRVVRCGAYRLRAAIVDLLDGHLAGLASQLLAELPAHRHALTLRTLLGRLSPLPGLVLAVDDVHAADEPTLDLLDQFVSWPAPSVLLALAIRPRQLPARLHRTLDDTPGVHRLALSELTAADVATLIGRPAAEIGHLPPYRDSGGNPFYLKTLLALPPPYQSCADLEFRDPPPAARAAVAVELAGLSALARRTAYAAAVVGGLVEPGLVAEVAELSERDLPAAIDELVERDVLRSGPDARFVFRHPVFRHLVYRDSRPGWRLAAHTRADHALRSRHAPAVRRAAHLVHTAPAGGAGPLAQAASVVARHNPEVAARWLVVALRLAAGDAVTSNECTVLLHRLCQAVGHWRFGQDRQRILAETIRLLPDHPPSLRLTVSAARAQLERLLRRPARARQYARAGLAAAHGDPAAGTQVTATLMLELACAYLSHRYARQSRTHAHQALAIARDHGDPALRTCAAGVAVVAGCLAGRLPTADAELAQATRALDALPDNELVRRLDTVVWIGIGHLLLDRPGDALRHLDRAVEVDAGADPHLTSLYLLICRAMVSRAAGRLAAATDDAVRADYLAGASGSVALRALTTALRAGLATLTGDEAPARSPAASPPANLAASPPGNLAASPPANLAASPAANLAASPAPAEPDLFVAFEHVMLAEARLAAGDHDGCLALLDAGERDGSGVDPWSRVGRYELMTRAALRAHRYDEADQWAGRAEAVATELATPARTALAALARAQVLAVGEPLAAASVALPAAAALGAAGLVLDAARARAVAGCALATAGHLPQALDELAVAQAEFAGCGARRPEREVAAQRQRLDGRLARPKRSRSGVDALTARERQVAALVGQGMTNRQIAARLVVTEKTVEMHLSRAFTKLGVSNRTGLVRQMLLAQ